jgi:protoporphyrinogen oxidase
MFLKLSGGFVFLTACTDEFTQTSTRKVSNFPIHLESNRGTGHLVRSAIEKPISNVIHTETLIVGGGISGLAAACSLPNNDFLLCELNPELGGTSGAIEINGNRYSQGAHYDLAYPQNYGPEGLKLLQDLDIVHFNDKRSLWEFKDKQYLIDSENEEACYDNGTMRSSILANTELKKNFIELLAPYSNQFPLPSTLISPELHHLDHISFFDYLNKYLPVDQYFIEAIDYQMLDDYGGTSRQISALAGIHYYKCRPYYTGEKVELFSPPQGNYYFIDKMKQQIPASNIKNNHLVFGLNQTEKGWQTDVYDVESKTRKQIVSDNIVYAGQKHPLKYIYPESYAQFNDVAYAPWVIVTIELKPEALTGSKWQNDFLSPNAAFLGFVDSQYQNQRSTHVLTAYYCFSEVNHHMVANMEENVDPLVHETIDNVSLYFKRDISELVKQVHVKLLGHAMPIPQKGYLTKERNLTQNQLSFAGVDTGRLPLMFDAMDSGIQAVKSLNL